MTLVQKSIEMIGGRTPEEDKKVKKFIKHVVNLKLIQDFNVEKNDINSFNIINENFMNDFAVLLFYDPECPHCKRFQPSFAKLAEMFKDRVSFGAIDISDYMSGNDILTDYFKIIKVPTIFFKGKKYTLYNGKADMEELIQYICFQTGKCLAKKNPRGTKILGGEKITEKKKLKRKKLLYQDLLKEKKE